MPNALGSIVSRSYAGVPSATPSAARPDVPLRFAQSLESDRQTRSSLLQHALLAVPRSSQMTDGCRTCRDCKSSNFPTSHSVRTTLSNLSSHRPRTAAVFARNSVSQLSTTIVSGTLSSTAAIITNFRPSGVTS